MKEMIPFWFIKLTKYRYCQMYIYNFCTKYTDKSLYIYSYTYGPLRLRYEMMYAYTLSISMTKNMKYASHLGLISIAQT